MPSHLTKYLLEGSIRWFRNEWISLQKCSNTPTFPNLYIQLRFSEHKWRQRDFLTVDITGLSAFCTYVQVPLYARAHFINHLALEMDI